MPTLERDPEPRWEEPASRRSALVPIGVAVLAAAAVGWFASGGVGEDPLTVERPSGEPEIPVTDAERDRPDEPAAGAWERLPHAPLVRRSGHSATWTGEGVIIWGGARPEPSPVGRRAAHLRSGAAYNPAADRWRRLAPAPIAPRDAHVAAWSGEELLVWGGRAVSAGRVGAAYDPSGGGWRELAAGPLDRLSASAQGVWTGRELLVWALDGDRLAIAGYDPTEDAWRVGDGLEVGPGAAIEAAWAGDRLAVLVVAPGGAGQLFRYRPPQDAWDRVSGHVFPHPEAFAAVEETLVLWGYTSGEQFGQPWTVALDVRSGDLRRLPAPSVRLAREHHAVSTGARLLVWDGRRGAVLDLDEDRWTTLPDAPLAPRVGAAAAWTGRELVVWGGGGTQHHADGATLRLPARAVVAGGPARR